MAFFVTDPHKTARSAFVPSPMPVAIGGYRWLTDEIKFQGEVLQGSTLNASKTPILVALDKGIPTSPDRAESRYYVPSNMPTLHRIFADVRPDMEGVAAFCTDYGMLGRLVTTIVERDPQPFSIFSRSRDLFGESLKFWVYQITKIRSLLMVYDALRGDSPAADLSRIGNDREPVRVSWVEYVPFEPEPDVPGWFKRITLKHERGEWTTAYPFDLRFEMGLHGGKLESISAIEPDDANEFLLYALQEELFRGVYVGIGKGLNGLVIRPRDLLGVMYAHFAMEVTGQTPALRRCAACGEWFEQKHARREYCSGKCKTRASRARIRVPA